MRERGGVQHSGWPGGAFQTKDAKWLVFTAPAQHLFERLATMLGQPELPRDPRFSGYEARGANMGELLDVCARWFAHRTYAEAVEALRSHDVPHAPNASMADIFADPHYRARGTIIDVPAEGLGTLPQPTVVPRLSATPGRVTHAGPTLGRHTDEVLGGLLGMTAADLASLRAEGVI